MDTFYLIGYSFGSLITLKLAKILENKGFKGQILLIDGAPLFVKRLAAEQLSIESTDEFIQTILLSTIVPTVFPQDNGEFTKSVLSSTTWESRINKLIELSKNQKLYSDNYIREMSNALFNRIRIIISLDLNSFEQLNNTPISFVRPSQASVVDIDEDYGLSKYSTEKIIVKYVEGNHMSMLENSKLTDLINELIKSNN